MVNLYWCRARVWQGKVLSARAEKAARKQQLADEEMAAAALAASGLGRTATSSAGPDALGLGKLSGHLAGIR